MSPPRGQQGRGFSRATYRKLTAEAAKLSAEDTMLAAVIQAWPKLPEPVKAGILAMVKATQIGG